MHAYHRRTVADVPLDSRAVVLQVRVHRLVCPASNCCTTFREQVPGVLDRYQRRTTRMTHQVRSAVRELAGRASVRLLSQMACRLSRHTAIRALLRIPLLDRPVPKVLGVDLSRLGDYPDVVGQFGGIACVAVVLR
ncbi:hypothetical protein ACFXG4_32175 [Nocardia sp. NPDC059246]|uniref:hypothetical protein n=1 Tax=unclassified Nocardia TaxID=2637762 RepID=UPI0036C41520